MAKYGLLAKKGIEILRLLQDNPEGLRTNKIQGILGYPQRTIYNNLNKLSKLGYVENIFPIWHFAISQAHPLKMAKLLASDKIQAHKFTFILRLISKPDYWSKRNNQLMKLKEFHFNPIQWGSSRYQQLSKDNFIIQTFSNSIVFINQRKYVGVDPYDCFLNSLEDTLKMLDYLEKRIRFKFFKNMIPQFSVRTHHYVKLKDAIAEKCRKEGRLFELMINGKLRAWMDLSEPLGLEFGHKNYAVEDARRYQQVVEDYIENKASLPSEVDKRIEKFVYTMEGVTNNQEMFDKNFMSHLEVIRDLGTGVNKFNNIIGDLFDLIKKNKRFK